MDRPRANIKRLLHNAVTKDGKAGVVVAQRDDGAEFELVFDAVNLPQIIDDLQTLAGRLRHIREGLGDKMAGIAPVSVDSLQPVKRIEFLHNIEDGSRVVRCTLPSGEAVSLCFPRLMAGEIAAAFSPQPQ